MSLPEISVVVPCRNERWSLGNCLDAIDAQDYPPRRFEVIVVDGRSTDGCREFVQARGLRVLDDPGRGPAAARNLGIRAASGEIVAFTDADCVPRFDWLSHFADAFRRDPTLAGVAGPLRLPRATLLGRIEDNDARRFYRGYITSNVAYRRSVLLEVGGFDEMLCCAEDYDLAWRVLDRGHRIAHDERPVVLHDPPELQGSLPRYLRKQFWYARHDVPAHARAILRASRAFEPTPGSMAALVGGADALGHSVAALAAAAGVARGSPSLLAAGLGAAAVRAARHAWESTSMLGEGWRELPAIAAIQTAKALTRGAGTLVGVAELADPRAWRVFSASGAAGLASTRAPDARADRPAAG